MGTEMKPFEILIIDDHALLREGLKVLLEANADMRVVGEAERGEDGCRLAVQLNPDVVLMDVAMPGLGGAAATKRLKLSLPGVKILALSAYEDEVYVRQLFQSGAAGYVLKRTGGSELARAIRIVAGGGTYVDPSVVGRMVNPTQKHARGAAGQVVLSDREKEVLRFTARGFTNKEIGQLLNLSVKTVETYKARIGRKLGFTARAEIVRYAMAEGWMEDATLV